jgi:hypothetical protein
MPRLGSNPRPPVYQASVLTEAGYLGDFKQGGYQPGLAGRL